MTLILNDDDVRACFDMTVLVAGLEQGLREQAAGNLEQPPRLNVPMRFGMLRVMPVALNGSGLFGFKAFHWTEQGGRFLISVYEQDRGELLALLDGNFLTAARTGAVAAVAANSLARQDATRVAVIGSGTIAKASLQAACSVRDISEARVFSPGSARREAFADWARESLGIAVTAPADARSCVEGSDIVIVATNTGGAADPIAYRGEWMAPGVHVGAIGSTMPGLRELDTRAFERADLLVVDAPEQMSDESGDVIAALAEGVYGFPSALQDVVAGRAAGRTRHDEVTLFKSVGTGMQDVIAGYAVYQAALRASRGIEVDLLGVKPLH